MVGKPGERKTLFGTFSNKFSLQTVPEWLETHYNSRTQMGRSPDIAKKKQLLFAFAKFDCVFQEDFIMNDWTIKGSQP